MSIFVIISGLGTLAISGVGTSVVLARTTGQILLPGTILYRMLLVA
ncbi:MAG: hypothetical protein IKI30_05665 [Oxalobacter sp.]|nr:hypothetical protein [Oxalobacter sp.]